MSVRIVTVIVRLRARRLANVVTAGISVFSKDKPTSQRSAEGGNRTPRWLIAAVFAPMMLLSAFNIASFATQRIAESIGPFGALRDATAAPVLAAALLVGLLWMAVWSLSLASRGELSKPEWDLPWLATLPAPTRTLLFARIFERSVVHAFGHFLIFPALTTLAWRAGWRYAAPLLGFGTSWLLLIHAATLRTLVETWLRLHLSPGMLRNVQAALTVAALVPMYLAMGLGTGSGRDADFFVFDWMRATPGWVAWSPVGLAAQVVLCADPSQQLIAVGLLLAETVAVVLGGLALMGWLLRDGFVATEGRESSRHAVESPRGQATTRRAASGPKTRWLSTIQRKELLLLRRDRTFLVQTLVVPVLVVGAQWLINPQLFDSLLTNPQAMGAATFGIGAYTLCFSALQALNAEGSALWLLYATPIPLRRVIVQKGALWGGIVLVLPVALLATLIATDQITAESVAIVALIALGLPIYGVIAACLGVFACRPLETEKARRLKPSYLYLFMLLASLHTYALYADGLWPRLTSLVLSTLLALALWQKATDRLPYLLDPTAAPPARVSLSDGLIAAQSFFVLQALVLIVARANSDPADAAGQAPASASGALATIAFCVAGGVTWLLARLVYWRTKAAGVPAVFGAQRLQTTLEGALAGVAAGAVGLGWLWALTHVPQMPAAWRGLARAQPGARDATWWLLLLAVVAAPIFEEFIFRGLIYGGLRRSFGVTKALIASAAVFAVVHPAASALPVFVLGLATAWIYERGGRLWPAMVTHGVYNLLVVGSRLWR